jgi:hypothetical protein
MQKQIQERAEKLLAEKRLYNHIAFDKNEWLMVKIAELELKIESLNA